MFWSWCSWSLSDSVGRRRSSVARRSKHDVQFMFLISFGVILLTSWDYARHQRCSDKQGALRRLARHVGLKQITSPRKELATQIRSQDLDTIVLVHWRCPRGPTLRSTPRLGIGSRSAFMRATFGSPNPTEKRLARATAPLLRSEASPVACIQCDHCTDDRDLLYCRVSCHARDRRPTLPRPVDVAISAISSPLHSAAPLCEIRLRCLLLQTVFVCQAACCVSVGAERRRASEVYISSLCGRFLQRFKKPARAARILRSAIIDEAFFVHVPGGVVEQLPPEPRFDPNSVNMCRCVPNSARIWPNLGRFWPDSTNICRTRPHIG